MFKRGQQAFARALAEASGLSVTEIEFAALTLYSAMAGVTRAVLEVGAPPGMVAQLREELLILCQAYVAKTLRAKRA